jgi:hypothetical protein
MIGPLTQLAKKTWASPYSVAGILGAAMAGTLSHDYFKNRSQARDLPPSQYTIANNTRWLGGGLALFGASMAGVGVLNISRLRGGVPRFLNTGIATTGIIAAAIGGAAMGHNSKIRRAPEPPPNPHRQGQPA